MSFCSSFCRANKASFFKEIIEDDDDLMRLNGGENASFGESSDEFCKSTITRAEVLNLIVGLCYYLLQPMDCLPALSLWYMLSSSSSLRKCFKASLSDVKSGKCENSEISCRGFDLTQE